MKKEARNEMTGYPSIDRPWLKYYSDEAINVEIPHMTAYDYICLCNKNRLNETAINYFGRLITYEELFHKINKCASQFAQLGVGKGDIVSICMPTTVETIVAFYALNSIGAISDMLDPRSNKDQLKFYLKENESEILVLFDACYFKIKEIISETNIQKVILVSAADSMPTVTKIGYYIKNRKKVWLHSGDIGHMSKQGVLTIDSRMERMIIRFDGFKIFPPSIENVITQHPDIEECAVIGIEDNANGKVPKAFLVMKHECKRDTGIIEGEIRELCTTKLAERAVPYYFEFIDELPMTMMGKVDYRKLEKEY